MNYLIFLIEEPKITLYFYFRKSISYYIFNLDNKIGYLTGYPIVSIHCSIWLELYVFSLHFFKLVLNIFFGKNTKNLFPEFRILNHRIIATAEHRNRCSSYNNNCD